MKIKLPGSTSRTANKPQSVAERHYVNGNPLKGPWPEGLLSIVLGRG